MNNDFDLKAIKEKWDVFVNERDWRQFHSPKNLAISTSVEASELLELFLWISPEESQIVMQDTLLASKIKEEVADVFLNLFYLAETLGVNLQEVALDKIDENVKKYPAHIHKGISKKYGS